MKLQLSYSDSLSAQKLKRRMDTNLEINRLYSRYLNYTPRILDAKTVKDLAKEAKVSVEESFLALFASVCGLDTSKPEHRSLERDYLVSGLHLLDPDTYRNDAYYRQIRFPDSQIGKWTFKKESFLPFEPFVCDDPILFKDFREVPQIGYFTEEYVFPSVLENGVEWMTVTPNEVETMKRPIESARGKVITFGLGLGYYLFHVAAKKEVTSVTVIERDADLISMFKEHLLPQFPHSEKITLICSDAYDYLENTMSDGDFDTAFADLWHDPSDGLSLYLRFKRLEKRFSHTAFTYWIENTLLSFLRGFVSDRIFDTTDTIGSAITSYAQLAELLSNESLLQMAPDIEEFNS